MRILLTTFVVVVALAASSAAQFTVNPTTTLAKETGNNTSAANSFGGQKNGNLPAGNVSKENVHQLLYAGHSTKIFVNHLPWFGSPSHVNVGYDSADPAQARRQVDDMVSRGFDGVVLDWFGVADNEHNTKVNNASLAIRDAVARYANFQFAIMEDQGALKKCANTYGCDITAKLITDLKYAWANYMQHGNYQRINGRPVVYSFDLELKSIDWNRVAANIPFQPHWIFRNVSGFTRAYTGGSYSWIQISGDATDTNYLNNFYYNGTLKYASKYGVGSVYKGFNDSIAAWSLHRYQNQHCGQTWLRTFASANKYHNTSNQLDALQVVTWNDYEEGTEIETGIDNCVSVNASVSSGKLNWTLSGNENTIDHYEVFVSADGQNLQKLNEMGVGSRSLDLASFGITRGNYTFFVKAVGKPSLRNKMSNGARMDGTTTGTTTPSTGNGVTITSPSQGSTSGSPVRVTATAAVTGRTIASMRVYVDGVDKHGVSGNKVDTSISVAAGTRNIVINAWDTAGAVYKSSVTFTAGSTSSSSTSPTYSTVGVTITSPAQGATTGSPVRIVASAWSSKTITSMVAYIDGQQVYKVSGGKMDASIAWGRGMHTLIVNAWDASGAVYKSTRTFTIQ